MHATNLAGDGAESAPSAPITLVAPPSPPLSPSALARGNTAKVSFLAPLSNGGSPVLDYTLTSSPGGLTVAGNPAPDSAGEITLSLAGLTTGTTYTFSVTARNAAGSSQPSTSNAVTVQPVPAPANDNFASGQAISGASGSATGTNVGATKEPGEPDHDGDAGGASVWYVWTAPANVGGSVTFDTCGSSFTTLLAAYQGGPVDSLSPVPSPTIGNPQGCSAGGHAIRFDVPYSGGTYYIAVDGTAGPAGPAEGAVVLTWAQHT